MDSPRLIDKAERLQHFRRSAASNLLAEVFIDELQYIIGEDALKHIVVKNQGMNPRVQSKDILDVTTLYVYSLGEMIELSLARNSIYHQLPEFLFHPLTLGEQNMSQREVVNAIKSNKKKEKETLNFFSPFDTAFLKERVKIHQRYLHFFSGSSPHKNLNSLIKNIIGKDIHLSFHEQYKLFHFLCKNERYKENLSEISILLYEVLGLEVRLRYCPCVIMDMPYQLLGECVLGLDSGLCGEYVDETDDVEGMIVYHDKIPNMETVEDHIVTIKSILDYFILSKRNISMKYTLDAQVELILGENRLGFDTHI